MIEHLPDGIGTPSDFEYEWEDVSFHSRVWETGPDPEGAFKVDLTVKTLRGEKLTDLEALKTFLIEYEEKDPDSWELTPVKVGGYDGLFTRGRGVLLRRAGGSGRGHDRPRPLHRRGRSRHGCRLPSGDVMP